MYLIYLIVHDGTSIPTLSIIMLAAIYGLQALVFIFRRKWDMIGWMVFYILAIPAFSFFLPLYSFWRMDDFSWGQTRVVLGEKGKKLIVHVRLISMADRWPVLMLNRMRASSTRELFRSSHGTITCVERTILHVVRL